MIGPAAYTMLQDQSSSISGILRGKPSKPILCMGQKTVLVPRISRITLVWDAAYSSLLAYGSLVGNSLVVVGAAHTGYSRVGRVGLNMGI